MIMELYFLSIILLPIRLYLSQIEGSTLWTARSANGRSGPRAARPATSASSSASAKFFSTRGAAAASVLTSSKRPGADPHAVVVETTSSGADRVKTKKKMYS